MKLKRILAITIGVFLIYGITSCTSYPNDKGMKHKAETMVDEPYTLERRSGDKNSELTYTFSLDQRDDVEFHVVGTPHEIRGEDQFNANYFCDYRSVIRSLYSEDVYDYVTSHSEPSDIDSYEDSSSEVYTYYYECYDIEDVDTVLDVIEGVNDIYSEELEYHDDGWWFPVGYIHIIYITNNGSLEFEIWLRCENSRSNIRNEIEESLEYAVENDSWSSSVYKIE